MFKKHFPILQWLPNYKTSYLSGDISAGIIVGVMLIPQGMAYAMLAGLPPVFGLYAALVPQIIYAIMGTSRQLAVGPVAMDSLLVASGLGMLAITGIDEYIAMAIFLALFMGLIQLVLGVLKMGFLVSFLSKPVISGFTSAAAIIIGLSQLKHVLGTTIQNSSQIHVLIADAFLSLNKTNIFALTMGLVAMLIIITLKTINTKIPAALVVVVLGILAIYFLDLEHTGVKILGKVPSGLPAFKIPIINFDRLPELLSIAITLALIAFMESISVSKAIQEKHNNYELDPNQELIAIGTSNIIGSFFQSYPTAGGFSRTAVNDQAGAKTGVSPLISAVIVGLTLLFLTPLFYYLPNAILGAIIMVAVFGLIDFKYPLQLFKTRKDEFILLVITFITTLTIGIKNGILIGVLLSLLLLVYRTSRPHIAVLGKIKGSHYFKNVSRFAEDIEEYADFLIIRFDAQLYFGNKDYFKTVVLKHIAAKGDALKFVILNAEAISYIDSTAMYMLRQLITDLKEKNIEFIIAGSIGPTRDILYSSGLIECIGKAHLFVTTHDAFKHCKTYKKKSEIEDLISLQSKNRLM